MRSNTLDNKFVGHTARVLLVLCECSEAEVRRILAKHAHIGWEQEGKIRLLVLRNNFRRFRTENSEKIAKLAPKHSAARIILLDGIEHCDQFGQGKDFRTANIFDDLRSFGEGISAILYQGNLDWRSHVTSQLRAWLHSLIDEDHVQSWLDQFRRFGVPWIGEHLLRTLDFWGPERLTIALSIDGTRLQQFDCICLKRQEPGKSADFLGNLLRKRVNALAKDFPIHDFTEFISNAAFTASPKRVLFIEDSLLTGTEMTNFLSGLLGLPSADRPWSVAPLQDPSHLLQSDIKFQFPVSTSLGTFRLKSFLKENGFKEIELQFYESEVLEVLTNPGVEALATNTFYYPHIRNCPIAPDTHLERCAFRGPWKSKSQRQQMEKFCGQVGKQLFQQYLVQKGWNWPEEKINASSFGMQGLGLNLAFCHSVPKASLPLLWAKGKVNFDGSTLEWLPLFSNAAL